MRIAVPFLLLAAAGVAEPQKLWWIEVPGPEGLVFLSLDPATDHVHTRYEASPPLRDGIGTWERYRRAERVYVGAKPSAIHGYSAAWAPGGRTRVRTTRATGDAWSVYECAQDGSDEKTLRELGRDVRDPKLSRDGKSVLFFRITREKGKQAWGDLVRLELADGKETKLLENVTAYGFAWSPKGDRIAVDVSGEFAVIDAASGKRLRTVKHADIDKRLFAHGAHRLLWCPDGTRVAASLTFLGGRAVGPGDEPEDIFGDREIFVIPVAEGKTQVVRLPEKARNFLVRWRN